MGCASSAPQAAAPTKEAAASSSAPAPAPAPPPAVVEPAAPAAEESAPVDEGKEAEPAGGEEGTAAAPAEAQAPESGPPGKTASTGETTPPDAAYVDDAPFENGHGPLAEAFATQKASWAAMNAKATPPAEGKEFMLALIADQDEASHVAEKVWESYLAFGKLTYNGAGGAQSYSLEMTSEAAVDTDRGDKSKRGAEYSALEVFDGKLLTFCDRTGNIDELVLSQDEAGKTVVTVAPLVDGEGKNVSISMGDGTNGKPLKIEWTTQKGGKLVIGSTGKERTDDDGNIVHEGEMWCKVLDPGPAFSVSHIDTREYYNGLRAAAMCPQGAGYMIHESGRWSTEHNMWLFAPRKLSRNPYDEVIDASKCVNLMLASPDPVAGDGTGVIMQRYLGFSELRGCSDFMFVPGTRDCHVFILRTEETLDNVITSYASVIDLEGTILMAETVVARARKFEGACWVGGFKHFAGDELPATSGGDCVIS